MDERALCSSAVLLGITGNRIILIDQEDDNHVSSFNLAFIRIPLEAAQSSTGTDEPFATEVKEYMRQKYVGGLVSYNILRKHFARVFYGDEDVALHLVKIGFATVQEEARPPHDYLAAEHQAKKAGLGIHSPTSRPKEHLRPPLPASMDAESFALLGDHLIGCHVKLWIETVRNCCTFEGVLATSSQPVLVRLCGVQPPITTLTTLPDRGADSGRVTACRIVLHRLISVSVEEYDASTKMIFVNLPPDCFSLLPFLLRGCCSIDRTTLHFAHDPSSLLRAQRAAARRGLGMWQKEEFRLDMYHGLVIAVPQQNTLTLKLFNSEDSEEEEEEEEAADSHNDKIVTVKLAFLADHDGELKMVKKNSSMSIECSRPGFAARELLRSCCIGRVLKINEVYVPPSSPGFDTVPYVRAVLMDQMPNDSEPDPQQPVEVAHILLNSGLTCPRPIPVPSRSFGIAPRDNFYASFNAAAHAELLAYESESRMLRLPMVSPTSGVNDPALFPFGVPLPAVVEQSQSPSTLVLHLVPFSVLITLRLAGIMTPEYRDPQRTSDALREQFRTFTDAVALHRDVTVQVFGFDEGSGKEPAYYGCVATENGDLTVALLEAGLGIVHRLLVEVPEVPSEAYLSCEHAARNQSLGIWGPDGSSLVGALEARRDVASGVRIEEDSPDKSASGRQQVILTYVSSDLNTLCYRRADEAAQKSEKALTRWIRASVAKKYWAKQLPEVGDYIIVSHHSEYRRALVVDVLGRNQRLRVSFPDHGDDSITVRMEAIYQFLPQGEEAVREIEPLAHLGQHAFVHVSPNAHDVQPLRELASSVRDLKEAFIEIEYKKDNVCYLSVFESRDASLPLSHRVLVMLPRELVVINCEAASHSPLLFSKLRVLESVRCLESLHEGEPSIDNEANMLQENQH